MLNKKEFIEIMELVYKQIETDRKCSDAFALILPNDYTSGYDNDNYFEAISKLLKSHYNSIVVEEIDWFIWETNFGMDNTEIYDSNKNVEYNINSVEALYDYITITYNDTKQSSPEITTLDSSQLMDLLKKTLYRG